MSADFDVIVLGGGPAGENLAEYVTKGTGLTAAIVEGELLGGECSYYACMPSKALLRPIEVAHTAEQLGVHTQLDPADLLRRRDTWVSHYNDSGQRGWAKSVGVEVISGHGKLVGERAIEVDGRRLTARAIVLATGSSPVIPQLYAGVQAWGSRDATGVLQVPERLAIIGGGVVACEAATWLAALGSQVTLLVRGSRLLGKLEDFAADEVTRALRARGIDVRLGVNVTSCARERPEATGLGRVHGGPVTLTLDPGGELIVDEVLLALGRRPRLDDVGLDAVGLTGEDVLAGRLPAWLIAVGDASGEPQLTHWGKYRARVLGPLLAARLLGRPEPVVPTDVPVPQVVFTDPQVASVGLTEAQAREQGVAVVVSQVPFTSAAGAALQRDDATGGAKLLVDGATGLVVGATFVGPEVAELLQAATVAIVGAVPVSTLRHAVPSYPTASELWLRLLENLP